MATKPKITIVGSGALGIALLNVLWDNGQRNIIVYGNDKNQIQDLQSGISKFFPNITLPHVRATTNLLSAVKNSKYLILAIPSVAIKSFLEAAKANLSADTVIINGSKGFFSNTYTTVHKGIEKFLRKNNLKIRGLVSLLGPSYAKEIIARMPTHIEAVSHDWKISQEVSKLFSNNYFALYSQTDVNGTGGCSIYKNIIAIAAGMISGMGYKSNTLASLILHGLQEMELFIKFLKGKFRTLITLACAGDLILTSTSTSSRNFTFGQKFIKEKKKFDWSSTTVEGLTSLKVVKRLTDKNKKLAKLKIANILYEIIFNGKNPKLLIKTLWS